jgi:hypothetical protein
VYNAVRHRCGWESFVFSVGCILNAGLLIPCAPALKRAFAYSLSVTFPTFISRRIAGLRDVAYAGLATLAQNKI